MKPIRQTAYALLALTLLVSGARHKARGADPSPVLLPTTKPGIPDRLFKITDYGAVGDGKTTNTDAVRRTIEACAGAGGGRVFFPAGVYVTGPIRLSSNLELNLDAGATVLFSRNFDDYPLVNADFEGRATIECASPISGDNLHDVAITGSGVEASIST